MFLFYGTRASKIKEKRLGQDAICPNCLSKNSLILRTYSRYFHFFWIPVIPLYKTNVLECSDCKRTYLKSELTKDLKEKIAVDNEIDRPRRPWWQGIGCMALIVVFGPVFVTVICNKDKITDRLSKENPELAVLDADLNKVTDRPDPSTDSVSAYLQECIADEIEGIDTRNIRYYSKITGDKILILLKVFDMRKVKKETRKELVSAIEDCFGEMGLKHVKNVYIGVDGKWNMLMIKTPLVVDVERQFADKELLLDYYETDSASIDSLITEDSLKKEIAPDIR